MSNDVLNLTAINSLENLIFIWINHNFKNVFVIKKYIKLKHEIIFSKPFEKKTRYHVFNKGDTATQTLQIHPNYIHFIIKKYKAIAG